MRKALIGLLFCSFTVVPYNAKAGQDTIPALTCRNKNYIEWEYAREIIFTYTTITKGLMDLYDSVINKVCSNIKNQEQKEGCTRIRESYLKARDSLSKLGGGIEILDMYMQSGPVTLDVCMY